MVRNKNERARREGALARLRKAKFTEKLDKSGKPTRTLEQWEQRVAAEIATLEERLR